MIKEVSSIKDIKDETFLIKYGQDFCIPCEMTETNLDNLKETFYIPFYSCKNVDESVEKGYTSLPVVELHSKGVVKVLKDTDILMEEDELKDWIKTNA